MLSLYARSNSKPTKSYVALGVWRKSFKMYSSVTACTPHLDWIFSSWMSMTASYYTILYYTILYYTILYYTILYYTILYYTILYYTILYYIYIDIEIWWKLLKSGIDATFIPVPWSFIVESVTRCTPWSAQGTRCPRDDARCWQWIPPDQWELIHCASVAGLQMNDFCLECLYIRYIYMHTYIDT